MEVKDMPKEEIRKGFGASLKTVIIGAISIFLTSMGGTFTIMQSEPLKKITLPENSAAAIDHRLERLERVLDDLPSKIADANFKQVEALEQRQFKLLDGLERRHDERIVRIGLLSRETSTAVAGLTSRVDFMSKDLDRILNKNDRVKRSN